MHELRRREWLQLVYAYLDTFDPSGATGLPVVPEGPARSTESGRGWANFNPIELSENTLAVVRWNREQFEIPDIIGFADYEQHSSNDTPDPHIYPGAADNPGFILAFPYPKTTDTLRWLSVAGPEELILLRAAAGHVVRSTDPLLSRRVFSNRLDRRYRCWRFRWQVRAWLRFINRGCSLLAGHRYSAMYRTDIQGYYRSVDIERLEKLLDEYGCLGPAAAIILKVIRAWQSRDALRGLPIGPEAAAVVGNFLLHPVDKALEANNHEYLRWGDDILTFGRTIENCHPSMLVVDDVLSNLRLTRSISKTHPFDNPHAAQCNLRDQSLASLTELLRYDEYAGMEAVRSAYDASVRGHPEVQRYLFRWVINTLKNKKDYYACVSLAGDSSLMNVDPKLSCRYLKETGLKKDQRVVDALLDHLSKTQEDRFDGLDLHILNAMRSRTFGAAEAKQFKNIATDSSRRWPIRAYGWAAYLRTTQKYRELMEAARAETIPPASARYDN